MKASDDKDYCHDVRQVPISKDNKNGGLNAFSSWWNDDGSFRTIDVVHDIFMAGYRAGWENRSAASKPKG